LSYIGTPPSNAFTSLLKQDFSTSATTGYTLDHAVNNANDIALFINFVRQEPTAAYAASGTTLTLTSATASSDDMYCVYLGQALQTVNPANASVGISQLSATGTKDATTFLRGDNTFAAAGGGKINQVVYGSTTSAYNSTSASYTDTGLTAAITPSATSSKVIVLFTQAGDFINPDSTGTLRRNYLSTLRGSTEIASQVQECKYGFNGYEVPISFSGSILDSPNTTDATTYKTMAKIDNASGQSLSFQIASSKSQMILMEVLA
jgi:hypothetical protein